MKSIGIDLGHFSLKIAEVEQGSKQAILKKFYEYPLNPQQDWKISILENLRSYSNQIPKKGTIVVGMSEEKLIHHRLSFPFKEKFNILKSLPFESEDNIPMNIDSAIFEANVLFHVENEAHIISSVALQKSIEQVLSQCKETYIKPTYLSSEGISFANMLIPIEEPLPSLKETPKTNSLTALIHIGHRRSFFSIYENGRFLLEIRHIPWGGEKNHSSY